MKMTWLKTIAGSTLAILLLAIFAQSSELTQDKTHEKKSDEQKQEDSFSRSANARRLEGSWDVQVTPHNCQTGVPATTTPSMLTFIRGGTMQEIGSRIAPSLRGPGHGVWSHESHQQYTATFQFFRFNPDGTLAGRQIVRQETTLSEDGNSFTSTATAQVLDTGGNVIANNCSNGIGKHFE